MKAVHRTTIAGLTLAAALSASAAASAQTPSGEVEAVVVTAERAGVPIWRLTRGAGTVVLVGAINRIPAATPWRPAALEAAVARADAVILEPEASASVLDVGRIVLRARQIGFLPKGETVASRYGAAIDARLAKLAAADKIDKGYTRLRPLILSSELLSATKGPGKRAPSVADVAERAAKRAKTPRRPVLRAPVMTLVEDLTTDSPDDLRCLETATQAAEEGPAGALRRGQAYTERRIPDVLDSAIQRAEEVCAFSRSGPVGDAVRAAWRNTVEVELTKPGVVVAVAPLHTVAGPNGILDTLHTQGVEIAGPRWRRDQAAGQAF